LPSSYRPAGRFNRRQQSTRFSPAGEKPAGDRWLCRRAIDPQVDSIDANSRREFLQQEIDASRRRDMLQQEHLKCQQAKSNLFSKERGSS